MSDSGKTIENDTMIKSVKDAAENNEIVEFRIGFVEETVLGKNNTPALKLGLKCKDKNKTELDKWLTPVLWGTKKSNFYTKMFCDSLNVDTLVSWDLDQWVYDETKLKGATGLCVISINNSGYPEVCKWIKKNNIKEKSQNNEKEIVEFDDDIPF